MRVVRLVNTSQDIEIHIAGRMLSDSPAVKTGWDFEEDKYPYSSLRDLSIIMNSMMGIGVIWHLGYEISRKLNLNPLIVVNTIREIVKKYSQMSEEDVCLIKEKEIPDAIYFNQDIR